MATLKELQEQFAQAGKDLLAFREKSEWTSEEKEQFDTICGRYDQLEEQIAEQKRIDERIARIAQVEERAAEQDHESKTEVGEARVRRLQESGQKAPTERQKHQAFAAWLLRDGRFDISKDQSDLLKELAYPSRGGELRSRPFNTTRRGAGRWANYNGKTVAGEQRANMTTTVAGDGGETIPEGFMAELEAAMEAHGGLRNVCRVLSTPTGNDMPWPTVDDTANDAAILAENTDMGSSVEPTFAQIVFGAYKFSSKPILVTSELLTDSAFALPGVIGNLLGERLGRGTATYFATGTGSSQPQGITVGASAGVTAAAVAAITADELLALQQSLDPAYEAMMSVGWAMRKATLTLVRQLKADTGTGYAQYLWQPGLTAGAPATLLGAPVAIVQEMPAATTGLVPIVYGAMEKFVIRDAGPTRSYVLPELYRASDATGFVTFARCDSKVIQSAAIKKLTMA